MSEKILTQQELQAIRERAGCFLPGDNGQRARQVLAITADKQE